MARRRIFARAFGDDAVAQGRALATRAPLDLRVNALKATRPEMLVELEHLGAQTCRYRPASACASRRGRPDAAPRSTPSRPMRGA